MIYLGIDPGVSGGLAVVNEAGVVQLTVAMPATHRDVLDILDATALCGPVCAFLERVSSSPQMGVVSAFTFGKGYGALGMALTAARIPYDEITPGKWQLVMGCLSKGEKNVTKRRAQQLFPAVTVTHAVADALLLAECCRRLKGRK
jgi:Holliday junction resolvasome RuvABC endonuclease subunit